MAVAMPVYLDNMATTQVDPRVLDAMLPYFCDSFGNPASKTHAFGNEAALAVEQSREQVAMLLGARPREIVFTAGATESNNLALKGVADYVGRGHIITCQTEHKAVLDVCHGLEQRGFSLTYLDVDRDGCIDINALDMAIGEDTILVSLMAANNEVGTMHPLAEIGALCKRRGVLWHCDAAQAVGKMPLDVELLGIDLLSLSAHKLYGPKGQGALYIRSRSPRVRLIAQLEGGGQERGLRAGTLNVPAIVGLGEACHLARLELAEEGPKLVELRGRLYERFCSELTDIELNGHVTERLPGNLNVCFPAVDGAELLLSLRDIAISSGSACASDSPVPSPVLAAMGRSAEQARSTLRFGLGRFTTEAEIDYVAGRVIEEVLRLRGDGSTFCERQLMTSGDSIAT
jgi:cysteine desulfurase